MVRQGHSLTAPHQLATALIGLSSIPLLKTFINAGKLDSKMMLWQVIIHVTFVASAIALALIDRMTYRPEIRTQPAVVG